MTSKVSPKEIIREEIDARGWSMDRLVIEAGWTATLAREVLGGRKITRLVAIGLAQAFGTSEDLWVNLQRAYDAPTTGDALQTTRTRGRPKTADKPVITLTDSSTEPTVQTYTVAAESERANGIEANV